VLQNSYLKASIYVFTYFNIYKEECIMVKQKSISSEQALKLANAAAAKGNKADAEKYFNAVLVKYPDNKDAIKGIKNLNPNNLYRDDLDELQELLKKGQFKEVEVRAGLYLERYPEVQELWGLLGASIGTRGEHDKALPLFEKAAELSPDSANAQYNLANAYKATGDLDGAEKYYLSAIKLKSKFVAAHNNLGNIYMTKKEFDKAVIIFDKALKLAPKSVEVLINAATVYKETGDDAKAEELCDTARALRPVKH